MARLFVPLDVEFSTDDKILAAGPLAAYLYLCSLAFCKRNIETNGKISKAQLVGIAPNVNGKPKLATKLVEVGLWTGTRHGWEIAAWAKHNKPSDEIEHEREQKRLASMKANHTRHHTDGKRSATCLYCDPIIPPNRKEIGSQNGSNVRGHTDDVHAPQGRDRDRDTPEPEEEAETQPEEEVETETEPSSSWVGGNSTQPDPAADDEWFFKILLARIATVRTEQGAKTNPAGFHSTTLANLAKERPGIEAMLAALPHMREDPNLAADWYEQSTWKLRGTA